MTTSTTTKKPARTLSWKREVGALFMTIGSQESGYWLDPLPCDLDGERAFRLTKFETTKKAGQPDAYDVRICRKTATGSCECMGHLKHGHKTLCKHLAALFALDDRRAHLRARSPATPTAEDPPPCPALHEETQPAHRLDAPRAQEARQQGARVLPVQVPDRSWTIGSARRMNATTPTTGISYRIVPA